MKKIGQDHTNTAGAIGGSANARGNRLEVLFAGWAAVKLLVGTAAELPWSLPNGTCLESIACQSSAEVDDVVLSTTNGGTIYVQSKSGLKVGKEFDKAVRQLVRQYLHPDFGTSPENRLVIFTDGASGKLGKDLKNLLQRCRGKSDPIVKEVKTAQEGDALKRLRAASLTAWKEVKLAPYTESEFRQFLNLVHVTVMDLYAEENISPSLELLGRVVDRARVRDVWNFLALKLFDLACQRSSLDRRALWTMLRNERFPVSVRDGQGDGAQTSILKIFAELNKRTQRRYVQQNGYSAQRYVSRSELQCEFLTFVSTDARLMVVTGQSGNGKSSWCAHVSETYMDRPVLLIPGEELQANDKGLFHSIARAVQDYGNEHGISLPSTYELLEWLRSADIVIVVDGLDRAPRSLRSESRSWMSETLIELCDSAAQLVLTSRPEAWKLTDIELKDMRWLQYSTAHGETILQLEQFSEQESVEAAQKIGLPSLARYRHPGMMSLATRMGKTEDELLFHCDVIDRYLEECWLDIGRKESLMPRLISDFAGQLAALFLDNDDGTVEFSKARHLTASGSAYYQAICQTDLLLDNGGKLRLNPDEISEHLQGQQLNIAETIRQIADMEGRPIRQGILRSAIAQLERRDRDAALAHLMQIANTLEDDSTFENQTTVRSLCVSTLLELRELEGLDLLIQKLVKSWKYPNLMLDIDPLCSLLSSPRLPPMQRVELLWLLVGKEDGYHWRQKHWLTPEYAPNFRVTAWRHLMLAAVVDAEEAGFSFLLTHFDSQLSLDCAESNLGDLAQGVYLLAGKKATAVALNVAAADDAREAHAMLFHLTSTYPDKAIAWLSESIVDDTLDDVIALNLLLSVPVGDDSARYCSVARQLLARNAPPTFRQRCYQALTRGNDEQGALLLIEADSLTRDDLFALLGTKHELFSTVLDRLLTRIGENTLDASIMDGVFLPNPDDDMAALFFSELCNRIPNLSGKITHFSAAVEHLLYVVCTWIELPETVMRTITAMTHQGSPQARRNIIYFATSHTPQSALSQEGARVRREILELLVDTESDAKNLHLLVTNLFTRPAHDAYSADCIEKMQKRFPALHLAPSDFDNMIRDIHTQSMQD